MASVERYVNATIPDPYTILGLRLRPFSLGHYFLFRRFNCAFGSDNPEGKGGIDDLLLALCICSRTYDEFLEFIQDGSQFQKWTARWGKAVVKQIKRERDFNMFEKFLLFKRYMNE